MCLRGLLRGFGLKVGQTNRKTFEGRVRELAASVPGLDSAVDALLKARATLLERFRRLDSLVVSRARRDERAQLLMTVPGVAFASACPDADIFRTIEPAPHRRDGRKAGRQHPPRQGAAQQIQDRLDNPPERPLARAPDMRGRGKERLQQRLFACRQIAWQSQVRTGIVHASGVGPHR